MPNTDGTPAENTIAGAMVQGVTEMLDSGEIPAHSPASGEGHRTEAPSASGKSAVPPHALMDATARAAQRTNEVVALYESGVIPIMAERDALREENAALRGCRDHWKASFEHDRANVIRLRGLIYDLHASPEGIGSCGCEDCQLVREHATPPQVWCAMCGKMTDHRSGACPELHPADRL